MTGTEARVERKLAAIVAADVVGYSRLMAADEEGTLARLKSHRAELIDPKIAGHHGRIVKTTGDGVLIEFASAVDAVRCAVEIQSAMAARDADMPADRRIIFRVGINLGDLIIDGDDLFGDGVNVAARLESIADPGSIYVSHTVYEHVRDKLDLAFEDLGERALKNIPRPVHTYRIAMAGKAAATSPSAPALSLPERPSIAVLPFTNMSGDAEQEYFADGIVEDVITELSRHKNLFVIARNSSFIYKGRAVDIKQVGRELGVRYVLEGSVRKAGGRVRITGQLIDTTNGAHIWADKFDGALADIFDLQDRITASVVGAIEPSLRRAEVERAKRKRPENLDAYDYYLRALPHVAANSRQERAEALHLLDAALRLDPHYGPAHAYAAWCHEQRFAREGGSPDEQAAAIRHARSAVSYGSTDSECLAIAGFVFFIVTDDLTTARATVAQAIALNGNSILALGFSGIVYSLSGEYEKAIEQAEKALRLSPFDPMSYQPKLAIAFAKLFTGRAAEAVEWARQGLQTNPHFSVGYLILAAGLIEIGQPDEARAAARHLVEIEPDLNIEKLAVLKFIPPIEAVRFREDLAKAGLEQ